MPSAERFVDIDLGWLKIGRRKNIRRVLGGPGSGNFGHEGRPGEVGGSAPSGADVPKPVEGSSDPSGDFALNNVYASREDAARSLEYYFRDRLGEGKLTSPTETDLPLARLPFKRYSGVLPVNETKTTQARVNLEDLRHGAQNRVFVSGVIEHLRDPTGERIRVIKTPQGKYQIWDGHHRASAARMSGEKQIEVEVLG